MSLDIRAIPPPILVTTLTINEGFPLIKKSFHSEIALARRTSLRGELEVTKWTWPRRQKNRVDSPFKKEYNRTWSTVSALLAVAVGPVQTLDSQPMLTWRNV